MARVLLIVAVVVLAAPGAAAAADPAKLSANCTPDVVSPNAAVTCVVTVTDSGPASTRQPPTGPVTIAVQAGVGNVEPANGCDLAPFGAFSSQCTLTYTPTAIAGGYHTLLGTYAGDDGHGRATTQIELEVVPANDERDNATKVGVPARVTGTTEGATWNYQDDPELCNDAYGPVWYSLTATQSGRLAVRLTVHGLVDSVIAVFRQDRTKLTQQGCALTGVSGVAGVAFDADRGAKYLVAVAAPWDARLGGFTLETAAVPAVSLPGARLTSSADIRLDPLLHPGAAFSVALRQGVTYRIAASAGNGCVHAELLKPAARSTKAPLAKSASCTGYLVFTPGLGGTARYPLVVTIDSDAPLLVHVAVREATPDDLAPGDRLANGQVYRGQLSARNADVIDVYRFVMGSSADATVTLAGNVHADLLLLDTRGKQLACACDGATHSNVVSHLAAGLYYAAVRDRPGGAGAYSVTLRIRRPTSVTVHATRAAGVVTLAASIAPRTAGGTLTFEVERYDPLAGWQFVQGITRRLTGGAATATIAPHQGTWRIRAHYTQTLAWSASVSGWATVSV